MSQQEDLVRRYYAVFNERKLASYTELFEQDALSEAPGTSARGIKAMLAFDQVWITAFPEGRIESLRMTTIDGVVLSANWFWGGVQRGALKGPGGEIPPKGCQFNAPYCALFRVAGHKITAQRLVYDAAFVPEALGLVAA